MPPQPLSGSDALAFLRQLKEEGQRQELQDREANTSALDDAWGGKKPSGGLRYKPLQEGPVRRMATLKGLYGNNAATETIVSLMPTQEIEFREKGSHTRLRISLEVVLLMAAKADGERQAAAKKAERKARKAGRD